MYTEKDAITFADVETKLTALFYVKPKTGSELFAAGKVTGKPNDTKRSKRIIGDMFHTYYIGFEDAFKDEVANAVGKYVEEKVEVLRKDFPETHFKTSKSKDAFGDVIGFYLRVGATPPTDVSLTQPAIDAMLEKLEVATSA